MNTNMKGHKEREQNKRQTCVWKGESGDNVHGDITLNKRVEAGESVLLEVEVQITKRGLTVLLEGRSESLRF